jgi:hypothetical protein
MPHEPNRSERRIAEWLIAHDLGEFARRILAGEHWTWNPADGRARKDGHARTGPRRASR